MGDYINVFNFLSHIMQEVIGINMMGMREHVLSLDFLITHESVS